MKRFLFSIAILCGLFLSVYFFFFHVSSKDKFNVGSKAGSRVPDKVEDKRTGIVIDFTLDDEKIPEHWKLQSRKIEYLPLDEKQVARSLKIIQKALSKYPIDLIKKNIKTVYFLKSLKFDGFLFGGTYSRYNVYITCGGESDFSSDVELEHTFHHEFSSILLRNNYSLFDEKSWIQFNKIEYGKGSFEAIKNAESSLYLDTAYLSKGFLCEYGKSDIEEDFNTFAENIFVKNKRFYDAVKEYPEILGKFKLIVAFYSKLDTIFSENYFLSIN